MIPAMLPNGTDIFAGTADSGIFLSSNNGDSWSPVNSGLANFTAHALAINTSGIFAGTDSGMFLSTDNGKLWKGINQGLVDKHIYSILSGGAVLFAGTAQGVYISPDNGQGWSAAKIGMANAKVNSLMLNGTDIYACTDSGIFLSSDNGKLWKAMNKGLTSIDVQSMTLNGADILAATYTGGVFLSEDSGENWTSLNTGLTNIHAWALITKSSHVFVGTGGGGKGGGGHNGTGGGKGKGGVFKLADNGTSWTSIDTGLTKNDVRSLTANDTYLFAGTADGGVWKRSLSEITSGIDELTRQNISVDIYPNPASDRITLRGCEKANRIEIVNLYGETIYNKSIFTNPSSIDIDMKSFCKGIYFVRIYTQEGLQTGKVILQ